MASLIYVTVEAYVVPTECFWRTTRFTDALVRRFPCMAVSKSIWFAATLSKIKFSDLPFAFALKAVKGNGKRVIAVFKDPNCGYCKRFRQNLQDVDNVTVYTFLYNILSPESAVKSKNVWCSADRN
jgi:hypothetical protein